MKDTGYRDINGQHIYIDDTIYSPEIGEFKIKYRDDLGGLIMCQKTKGNSDDSFEFETIHEISFLEDNDFSVVGHNSDQEDEIIRKIIAIISRKAN